MSRLEMKPQLKIKPVSQRHRSVEHDGLIREGIRRKQQQLDDAVKYCTENGSRGWSALASGLFPLIKDPRTINKRLDGKVESKERQDHL